MFKTQIRFPSFISRFFAFIIDMAVLVLLTMPLSRFMNFYLYRWRLSDYFALHNVDITSLEAMAQSMASQEFMSYAASEGGPAILPIFAINCAMQLVLMAFYLTACLYYKAMTPGYFIIRSRIVDEFSLGTPSLWQLVKRFIALGFFFIGIWTILFDDKKRAWHDKISNTIIIKV